SSWPSRPGYSSAKGWDSGRGGWPPEGKGAPWEAAADSLAPCVLEWALIMGLGESDHHVIGAASHYNDFARLLQTADDPHDFLLSLLHISQQYGSEILDFFFEHLRSPLGHISKDPLAHFLAGRLQGEGPIAAVHFPDHLLNGAVVQEYNVLEDEEALPDGFGQFGVFLFQGFDDE